MKLLHTADWHIGESWKFLPQEYIIRQAAMIDNIYEVARKRGIKVVLVSGDLFHKREPNKDCRNMVLRKLIHYDRHFTTIIMEGNHDQIDINATAISNLRILFEEHKFKNTIVIELQNQVIPYEDGAFLAMPLFKETKLEEMVSEIKGKYKWIVAMIHDTTIGVSDDKGWTARAGWDMKEIPGITYYAFGHIHKAQRLRLRNAFQAGAPIQHQFSDKQPKGVLVVDTDNPENPKFIRLKNVKPLYIVKDGESIPEDGYVKLLTKQSHLGKNLPSNVVVSTHDIQNFEEIEEYDTDLDSLKGLTTYLASQGLNSTEQAVGISLVEDIIKDIEAER